MRQFDAASPADAGVSNCGFPGGQVIRWAYGADRCAYLAAIFRHTG